MTATTAGGVLVRLSTREREIVALVCEDLSLKDIARRTGLSPRTVEAYIRAISLRLPADCPRRGQRKIRFHFRAF